MEPSPEVKEERERKRIARQEIRRTLGKVIKKAASIAALLTDEDQQANLRVLREAKEACHVYITKSGKVYVPDHKTRLAAVALDLAYREGKPVERSVSASGSLTEWQAALDRIRTAESLPKIALDQPETFDSDQQT